LNELMAISDHRYCSSGVATGELRRPRFGTYAVQSFRLRDRTRKVDIVIHRDERADAARPARRPRQSALE
jgi:hypothetical protein